MRMSTYVPELGIDANCAGDLRTWVAAYILSATLRSHSGNWKHPGVEVTMEIAFFFKKLITALAMPSCSLLLCAIAGLLLQKRWPRIGRTMLWFSVLTLFALSTPSV